MIQPRPFQRTSSSTIKDAMIRGHINRISQWAAQTDKLLNGLLEMKLLGSSSGSVRQVAHPNTNPYSLQWPPAQGAASSILVNDGSGRASWNTQIATVKDHTHSVTGDGGDTLVANSVVGTNIQSLNTFTVGDLGASSGQFVLNDGNTLFKFSIVLPPAGLAANSGWTIPDIASAVPVVMLDLKAVNLTGKVANIATTNLVASALTGMWRITAYIECTTAGAGTETMTLGWTDDVGATTDATLAVSMAGVGRAKATFGIYSAGTNNITYATAGYVSGTYAIRIRPEYLG